jgi:hypothetical protein
MVEVYVQALQSLLERAAPKLDVAIECKYFFSGAAAYADKRIFMTLTTAGLAIKLPPMSRARMIDRGATPLRYFPSGPIKNDYVVVPEGLAEDDDALAPLVKESVGFVQTLPIPRTAK